MLTASADTGSKFVGTEKGDVFKADSFVSATGTYLPTLNSSDELDGGAGKDTLNITSDDTTKAYTMANATIKNIETITIKGADDVTADVSGSNITGLETISVLKSKKATVTAATTTDVNVSGASDDITVKGGNDITITDNTAASSITVEDTNSDTTGNYATGKITITDTKFGVGETIDVDGGTDVTITATADKVVVGAITVGANKAATGDVKIVSNTTSDGTAVNAAGSVTVTGGKTVEITANMTNTAVKSAAGGDITAGTYKVTADNTTTNVTITQNVTAIDFENDAAAATFETAVVTFGALKAGESVAISYGAQNITGTASDDLTFTASKDLTAAEVAAAFANLTDTTDTQSATGITANGYFTGKLDTGWTSGAVSGSSVTFTATTAGVQASDITVNTDATNNWFSADNATANANFGVVVTQGVAAVTPSTAVNVTEDFGVVVVNDNATKSITTITLDGFDGATLGGGASGSLDKLATLNLTNGQGTGTGTVLTSTVATLTVNVDDMAGTVDLSTAATNLKTLTLNANGEKSDFTLTATKVETLTIAAAADLDISTGTAARLAALKTVTITGAGDVTLGDISTALETLTASAATGAISATVGVADTVTTGSGNDTITVTAGDTTTAISKAIDLGAGDDTLVLHTGTTVVPTATVKGGDGVDTISMTSVSADAYDADETFKNSISGFERLEINNTYGDDDDSADTLTLDMEKLGFNYVITNGTLQTDTTGNGNLDDLRLINLAANATVELNANGLITAALKTPTGETDVINVVTNVTTSAVNFGTFTVASVETVNITANDTQLDDNSDDVIDSTNDIVEVATLNLTANAAKTVNVTGTSSLTLDTVSTTITKVDASKMTGDLVYTADGAAAGTEVIGGAGNDTLRASGEKDVLKGGAGNDTFYATDLTTVHGGAGADKFYFATPTQLSKVSTIADLGSGDTIYLVDNAGTGDATDDIVNKFYSAGAEYNVNTTTTFEAKVNASLGQTGAGESTWFQHAGNTYIVIDNKAGGDLAAGQVDTYTAGKDVVIEITGLVDLSTASFNATTGTLEIA